MHYSTICGNVSFYTHIESETVQYHTASWAGSSGLEGSATQWGLRDGGRREKKICEEKKLKRPLVKTMWQLYDFLLKIQRQERLLRVKVAREVTEMWPKLTAGILGINVRYPRVRWSNVSMCLTPSRWAMFLLLHFCPPDMQTETDDRLHLSISNISDFMRSTKYWHTFLYISYIFNLTKLKELSL